jgi:transglutaminase-like putative cysteine protease
MPSHRQLAHAITLVFLVPLTVHATVSGDDPSIVVEQDDYRLQVGADGSYVVTNETTELLTTDQAVRSEGQQYFYRNKQLDTIDEIEAYTIKADGRKIPVTPDQIKTQADPVSSQAPMFNDGEYKVVVFPDLAIGDRIHYKEVRHRQPIYAGYFSGTTVPAMHPFKSQRLIYDLPADMPLQFSARGYVADETPLAAKGRKVYAWHYAMAPKSRLESGSVAYRDYGDLLEVGTFKQWSDLARAYQANASDEIKPSPDVIALATKLTQSAKTPRDKALLLSDWVRKNIRYVAVYLGRGGVVPHPAATVLANRYGDCKDHATLLGAMLSAVGIDSTTALINQGAVYQLPAIPRRCSTMRLPMYRRSIFILTRRPAILRRAIYHRAT